MHNLIQERHGSASTIKAHKSGRIVAVVEICTHCCNNATNTNRLTIIGNLISNQIWIRAQTNMADDRMRPSPLRADSKLISLRTLLLYVAGNVYKDTLTPRPLCKQDLLEKTNIWTYKYSVNYLFV